MDYNLTPIAYVHSVFKEKFGVPRQSGLAPSAVSEIILEPSYCQEGILRGISGFSHLWLIFVFHENIDQGWHPTVRPPRLGGNERLGVFATRSPFRPNPLGLSVVKLVDVRETPQRLSLIVSGADLMDGTPILDIKPYVPSADAHPEALGGFTDARSWKKLQVIWDKVSREELSPEFATLIEEVLSLNPKPAFHQDPNRLYGMHLSEFNVRWRQDEDFAYITSVEKVTL